MKKERSSISTYTVKTDDIIEKNAPIMYMQCIYE